MCPRKGEIGGGERFLLGGIDIGKVVIVGDMNARVGDGEVEGVVGKFGVSGVTENGRKLIEMCTEKRLSLGNTFF